MFIDAEVWMDNSSVSEAITLDNLLDVKSHATRGAETVKEYVEDARRSGDHELMKYFERLTEAYLQAAREAAQLLRCRHAMPDRN